MSSPSNDGGSEGFSPPPPPPPPHRNANEASPRNRSTSFSISDILSEDIGRSKHRRRTNSGDSVFSNASPSSSPPLDYGDERLLGGVASTENACGSSFLLSDAATMMTSPQETKSIRLTDSSHTHPIQTTPTQTNNPNASITLSPFNPTLLQMLGQQSTPTSKEREDFFSDSLGMLSTVALYHNELSSTAGTPVQERMAAMKLISNSDISVESVEGCVAAAAAATAAVTKSTTPCILKHGRKRMRASSGSSSHSSSSVSAASNTAATAATALDHSTTFNTGFLSPLASEKCRSSSSSSSSCPALAAGFSPSIFLSRPSSDKSSSASQTSSVLSAVVPSEQSPLAPAATTTASPVSDHSTTASGEGRAGFITSTPIKTDKENAGSAGGKRLFIRDEMSSDSDGELHAPSKRPKRLTSRRTRARTKLSPLLENACSPIAKSDPIPPSPLALTSRQPASSSSRMLFMTPPPSSSMNISTHASTTQAVPVISIQDCNRTQNYVSSALYPPQNFQQPSVQLLNPQQQSFVSPHQQQGYYPYHHPAMLPIPGTSLPPAFSYLPPPPLPPPPPPPHHHPRYFIQSYYPPPPRQTVLQSPSIHAWNLALGMHAQYWGGNPQTPVVSTSLISSLVGGGQDKGGASSSGGVTASQMQSVPPWFIFNQSKSEGKRSRLTEAINRSLTETPSQKPKLPAEWTKLACGQTADQQLLTAKARSFLQCQPRQLVFDEP